MTLAPPERDAPILVIGAGPAGCTAAMRLQEMGYSNVVVFEKEDQVGGKCRNFYYNGKSYDLGANLTTPRYTTVRPLAEKLGVAMRSLPERRIANLTEETIPNVSDAGFVKKTVVRTAALLYIAARGLAGVDRNGYVGLPKGVRRSYGDWLESHHLTPYRGIFANLFIAYGYGIMNDLPAAYALKFFDPIHLFTAVNTALGTNLHTTKTFEGGFQRLWIRVVEEFGLDVRLNTRITAIERKGGHADVEYEDEDGKHTARFDRVVMACPLQNTGGWLDWSSDEERLFTKIRTYNYYVTAAVVKGLPDISTYVYPYSMNFTPGEPTVFYPPVVEDDPDVWFFYGYGDDTHGEAEIQAGVRKVLADPSIDAELVEILHTQLWDTYFPHVGVEDFEDGFYDQLDEMQGRRSTIYVGELLCFPLTELIMRHTREMIDRFF